MIELGRKTAVFAVNWVVLMNRYQNPGRLALVASSIPHCEETKCHEEVTHLQRMGSKCTQTQRHLRFSPPPVSGGFSVSGSKPCSIRRRPHVIKPWCPQARRKHERIHGHRSAIGRREWYILTLFDRQRLPAEVFRLDTERLRSGWYSDAYFINIQRILQRLSEEGYVLDGSAVGDIEVEMQIFTRRKPFSVIAGVDEALAILEAATGYYDANGKFVNTYKELASVEAVYDGTIVHYSGDPKRVSPVIRIRGRYRDFAILETPILGALAEPTRIATNVFEVLDAAKGKDLLFFPARFAHYKLQAMHGYAYQVAISAYNQQFGAHSQPLVSTDDQGAWWGGKGAGTMSHSFISAFLGQTEEAMLQFARVMPPDVPRVALVDFHNDCIGTTLRVMERMWQAYREAYQSGDFEAAKRFRLFGVRPDTSGSLRDRGIEPLGDPSLDCGVTPRLVWALRKAIDSAWEEWSVSGEWEERARAWCANVKIIATGGFDPEKIRRFEALQVPVDMYGIGSYLLTNCRKCGVNNDFTADIVRVFHRGEWIPMAKEGRAPGDNPDLQLVHKRA